MIISHRPLLRPHSLMIGCIKGVRPPSRIQLLLTMSGGTLERRDLESEIEVYRATLSASSPDSPERVGFLKKLADALFTAYDASRSVTTLEEAIALYEQVLRRRPPGHEARAQSVHDLGDALYHFCRFHKADRTRGVYCLDLLREGLQLRPPGHSLRDESLHALARALHFVSFAGSSDLDELAEVISLNREALQLRQIGHPDRYKSLNNLAVALEAGFKNGGEKSLLHEANVIQRESLDLLPLGHPHRAMALSNLGNGLKTEFYQGGGFEILTEAIDIHRQALYLRPPGHFRREATLHNLAGALSDSCEYERRWEALPEAILLQREVLHLRPEEHPERAPSMTLLATFLLLNHRERGDRGSLGEAVTLLRSALSLSPPGHSFREAPLYHLAEALMTRFENRRDDVDLSESIVLLREVVQLRPPGHISRVQALERLAQALCELEPPSWTESLALYREALRVCGSYHRTRLLSGISGCLLDPNSPHFDIAEGISLLSQEYAHTLSHVNSRLRSALSDMQRLELAYTFCAEHLHPNTRGQISGAILDLYAQVIGLLPLAANFGIDQDTRLAAVSGLDEIARNAAARAFLIERPTQAVELLEQGRGVFWSQSLHLRAPDLDDVPDEDRLELERLLQHLRQSDSRDQRSTLTGAQRERDMETRRRLNGEAEALISKIRGYPGLARFLMPPAFDTLVAALPDGFVVMVNASALGHHALLLHRLTQLSASLELKPPHMDFKDIVSRIPRDMEALQRMHDSDDITRAAMNVSGRRIRNQFHDALASAWASIVEPILSKLSLKKAVGRARPRLWWCLTGDLAFLPMHAAGIYRTASSNCTADYVVSSYTPTLSTFTKLRSGWTPVPCTDLAGLLICEMAPDNRAAGHLPNAAEEIRVVRECFDIANARVLNTPAPHTSLSDLRILLDKTPAHILHLACHGIQDGNPLKSAIMLKDGDLTIEDIMRLSLPQAVLAVLSACQTAKGDKNMPDQAVHIAASMLFCGFKSVIGTMWLMNDEDGPKLARHLYSAMFAKDYLDLDDIPYALDEAVQTLRTEGVPAERWALFMHMGG